MDRALKFYKTICVVLCALIGFSLYTNYKLSKNAKTIIVPTGISERVSVTGSTAGKEYMQIMTRYFFDLLYDYSEYNIQKKYSEFYKFVEPTVLPKVRKSLDERMKRVKQVGIVQSAMIQDFHITDKHIVIKGETERFVNNSKINTEDVFIKINFEFKNGRIFINGYHEIDHKEYVDLSAR